MRYRLKSFYLLLLGCAIPALCAASVTPPLRPTILFNRWQEDWSVLSNPGLPREPFDALKYIKLTPNPKTYLTLGANLRERFESNNAVNFGVGNNSPAQAYVISRFEVFADLRIAQQIQTFVELQSDFAPGKAIQTPVDADRLSLEQGFVAIVEPIAEGTFKFRVGRQQFAFDLQRFISVRDGPNVRQSFDAIWADYELQQWRFISFYSLPVQNRNLHVFDDYSSTQLTYGGARAERRIANYGKLSAYYSHLKENDMTYPSVSGNERRDIIDVRYVGGASCYDWDMEAMFQVGTIANKNIRAWAFGSRSGYTFERYQWKPRPGLQIDAASGNQHANGNTLGTFNPLFPNGEYITLAGYTGYTNFIHIKPSITLTPMDSLSLMFAIAAQFRQTTADAVYTQPMNAVPDTAGEGGRYTGTYLQGRIDWRLTPHITTALEIVHFNVAEAIRHVGGQNANYLGAEIKMSV